MKKADIKVGGFYQARISGRYVTVRVDSIRDVDGWKGGGSIYSNSRKGYTVYGVTNLNTKRTTTFRSAMKFRGPARSPEETEAARRESQQKLAAEIAEIDEEMDLAAETNPDIHGDDNG